MWTFKGKRIKNELMGLIRKIQVEKVPRTAPLVDKPPIFGKLTRNLRLELLENPKKLKKDAPKISHDDPRSSPVKPQKPSDDSDSKKQKEKYSSSKHSDSEHDARHSDKEEETRHRDSDKDERPKEQKKSSHKKVDEYSDDEKELLKQLADDGEELVFIDDSDESDNHKSKSKSHSRTHHSDDEDDGHATDRSEVKFEKEKTDDERGGNDTDRSHRRSKSKSRKSHSDDDTSDDEEDKKKEEEKQADDGLPPKDPWEEITDPVLREKTARKEFMWRFYILKSKYPEKDIGGYDAMMDSEELKIQYEKKIKEIYIEQSIEDYTMYLFAGFIAIEYVATQYIGIDMRGFTKSQIYMMYKYHILLVELAEKNSHRFAGFGLPVEIRLAGLVLFSAATFWLMKLCEKRLGSDIAGFLSGMLGQTKMRPQEIIRKLGQSLDNDDGKSSESDKTEQPSSPSSGKSPANAPPGKRRMRGPTVNADNVE